MRQAFLAIAGLSAVLPALAQVAETDNGARVFQTYCTRCHIPIEISARLRNDWYGHSGAELL